MTGPYEPGAPGAVTLLPVHGLGEVRQRDDLAALIAAAASLDDGDVVVVAQKIVSKAEGAVVRVPEGRVLADLRLELARAQARRIVADAPGVLIVETRHGFVCANAGIDASNAEPSTLLLLPDDPDASARRLRDGLARRTGRDVGVVITDTFGRPWRLGQTDVAIGVAGVACIRDERTGVDRSGRPLEVTQVAVVDEIAAAADLVRRKADGVPVCIVRGLDWDADDAAAVADLLRPPAEDHFLRGRGRLPAALGAREMLRPLTDGALAQATHAVVQVLGQPVAFSTEAMPGTVVVRPCRPRPTDRETVAAPARSDPGRSVPDTAAATTAAPGAAAASDSPPGAGRLEAVVEGAAAALLAAVLADQGYPASLVVESAPHVHVRQPDTDGGRAASRGGPARDVPTGDPTGGPSPQCAPPARARERPQPCPTTSTNRGPR